jgi:hypothetical protein
MRRLLGDMASPIPTKQGWCRKRVQPCLFFLLVKKMTARSPPPQTLGSACMHASSIASRVHAVLVSRVTGTGTSSPLQGQSGEVAKARGALGVLQPLILRIRRSRMHADQKLFGFAKCRNKGWSRTKNIAQCKYRTYLFRLQNGHITFMLTGPLNYVVEPAHYIITKKKPGSALHAGQLLIP